MFAIGDRVIFKHPFANQYAAEPAVVGKIKASGKIICVHFDNPTLEGHQSYEAGWDAKHFTLVEDEPVIEEDWS